MFSQRFETITQKDPQELFVEQYLRFYTESPLENNLIASSFSVGSPIHSCNNYKLDCQNSSLLQESEPTSFSRPQIVPSTNFTAEPDIFTGGFEHASQVDYQRYSAPQEFQSKQNQMSEQQAFRSPPQQLQIRSLEVDNNLELSKVDNLSVVQEALHIDSDGAIYQTQDQSKRKESKTKFIQESKRKQSKKICHHLQGLELAGRKDIVFKQMIREMRKFYKANFNEITGYSQAKRRRPLEFISECLDKYTELIISDFQIQEKDKNQTDDLRKSIIFLMGSMFYPKDFQVTADNKEQGKQILAIHKAFQHFSLGKLDFLNEYAAFGVLFLHFFSQQKTQVVRKNNMARGDQDQEKAYKFLEELLQDVKQ